MLSPSQQFLRGTVAARCHRHSMSRHSAHAHRLPTTSRCVPRAGAPSSLGSSWLTGRRDWGTASWRVVAPSAARPFGVVVMPSVRAP